MAKVKAGWRRTGPVTEISRVQVVVMGIVGRRRRSAGEVMRSVGRSKVGRGSSGTGIVVRRWRGRGIGMARVRIFSTGPTRRRGRIAVIMFVLNAQGWIGRKGRARKAGRKWSG